MRVCCVVRVDSGVFGGARGYITGHHGNGEEERKKDLRVLHFLQGEGEEKKNCQSKKNKRKKNKRRKKKGERESSTRRRTKNRSFHSIGFS